MGPKKKKGKKGRKGKKPKPDPGWAKAVKYGIWDRRFEHLPDTVKWPAFAEIRAAMLGAVRHLSMIWEETLTEEFLAELFSIPRPNLSWLELRGTKLLKKFVLAPYDVLPAINHLDLSCCCVLEFALIQSLSLESATFARCYELEKLLLETKSLKQLEVNTCIHLGTLMVWSDKLESLNLIDLERITSLELYCPLLINFKRPVLLEIPRPKVHHPTILQIMKTEDKRRDIKPKEFGLLMKDLVETDDDVLTYPNRPLYPRTLLYSY